MSRLSLRQVTRDSHTICTAGIGWSGEGVKPASLGISRKKKNVSNVAMHVGPETKSKLTASSGLAPDCSSTALDTVHAAVARIDPRQMRTPSIGSSPIAPMEASTQPATNTSIDPSAEEHKDTSRKCHMPPAAYHTKLLRPAALCVPPTCGSLFVNQICLMSQWACNGLAHANAQPMGSVWHLSRGGSYRAAMKTICPQRQR